jgi:hypothetical protein
MGIDFTDRDTDTIAPGALVRVEIRPGVYVRMSAAEAKRRGLKIKQQPAPANKQRKAPPANKSKDDE